jgi:hypothetical protein
MYFIVQSHLLTGSLVLACIPKWQDIKDIKKKQSVCLQLVMQRRRKTAVADPFHPSAGPSKLRCHLRAVINCGLSTTLNLASSREIWFPWPSIRSSSLDLGLVQILGSVYFVGFGEGRLV